MSEQTIPGGRGLNEAVEDDGTSEDEWDPVANLERAQRIFTPQQEKMDVRMSDVSSESDRETETYPVLPLNVDPSIFMPPITSQVSKQERKAIKFAVLLKKKQEGITLTKTEAKQFQKFEITQKQLEVEMKNKLKKEKRQKEEEMKDKLQNEEVKVQPAVNANIPILGNQQPQNLQGTSSQFAQQVQWVQQQQAARQNISPLMSVQPCVYGVPLQLSMQGMSAQRRAAETPIQQGLLGDFPTLPMNFNFQTLPMKFKEVPQHNQADREQIFTPQQEKTDVRMLDLSSEESNCEAEAHPTSPLCVNPSVLEQPIAAKASKQERRAITHAALLKKVQEGRILTKAEVKQLRNLEKRQKQLEAEIKNREKKEKRRKEIEMNDNLQKIDVELPPINVNIPIPGNQQPQNLQGIPSQITQVQWAQQQAKPNMLGVPIQQCVLGIPVQRCVYGLPQIPLQPSMQVMSAQQMAAPTPAQHGQFGGFPIVPTQFENPQQRNQAALTMYSNWTQFNKNTSTFFESQRALLTLVSADSEAQASGILAADSMHQRSAKDILGRVKEMASQIKVAQTDVLLYLLTVEKQLNEKLQNELNKLKDAASEFSQTNDALDHSELAERLDLQTARLADKDLEISELKNRLETRTKDVVAISSNEAVCTEMETEEDEFQELSTEAVMELEPRALIEHIRKELGVGADSFNPSQRRIIRAMREKLGSALEKLAHDIYSNDSQIILELVQNADDNYYNNVDPFLSIHIRSGKSMWVTNNECGFNNANVIAISNVGGSTKKDVNRFTGHKGIGFKSVFKVTRMPHIISKEFCFRFNLDGSITEDNIGYILPEWVEKEALEALIEPERIDPTMTHFYFPFSDASRFPAEELYQGIDLIPLFLRQLHCIELQLDNKEKVVVVTKEPRQSGLLEIFHLVVTESTTHESGDVVTEITRDIKYRVYRKMLDVPKDLQMDPAGRAIPNKTELILAFPVIPDATVDVHKIEIQKVYSYLPFEKAGFRFLIQADFHLVSSRDRVHAQNLYNRWLSSMIPAAFKDVFGLGDNPHSDIHLGNIKDELFLFLPTRDELTSSGHSEMSTEGFWRRVMKGIRDKVLDSPCVLTETSQWARPDEVCVKPKDYENLFTNAELQSALNKEWVSNQLADEAIFGLGCQYLTAHEALTIVNHPSFQVEKRSKSWFYKIYGFLGSQIKSTCEYIDGIFAARIFPLDTGALTSLKDGPLYTMATAGQYKIGSHILRLLAVDFIEKNPDDPAWKFLEKIGITSMTPLDVANVIWIEHQRMTRPFSDTPASSTQTTNEQVWEQLRFLKDHWSDIGPLYPYLENGLLVPVYPTKQSIVKENCYHFASFTYFSELRPAFDEINPELKNQVIFLNDQHLNELSKQEKRAWIKFLSLQLKVNDSLRVIATDNKEYVCSKELNFAVMQATKDANETDSNSTWTALLSHMEKNWKHFNRVKYLVRQIKRSYSGFPGFSICQLFPDFDALKNLLLNKEGDSCIRFPTIPGLTNEEMMTDLDIAPAMNGSLVLKLASYLENVGSKGNQPPMLDLHVWNKIYSAMVKWKVKPEKVLILQADGTGKFEKIADICLEIPQLLQEWVSLVKFPAKDYTAAMGMEKWVCQSLSVSAYMGVLFKIIKVPDAPPSKHALENVILECYRQINTFIKPSMQANRINLVFDRAYLLRGWKTANKLVMPDQKHILNKFLLDKNCFCPIKFVHSELAEMESLALCLCKSLNIPLLSKVVQICPMQSSWRGYYTFAPGTSTDLNLPVYLSANLSNLYRALLAEFQSKAKTLSLEENFSLGNLLRGILVFVLAFDAPSVPVAYTIYGMSRLVHEDYFIHTSISGQVSVIVSARTLQLPLDQQVNLNVLKLLFPPLVVDEYLRTCIRRMLDGSVLPKLEQQNRVQLNDDLQKLDFKITVEDSEVVRDIHEARNKPRAPGARADAEKRTYQLIYAPESRYGGPGIPGLTRCKPKEVERRDSKVPGDQRHSEDVKPLLEFPRVSASSDKLEAQAAISKKLDSFYNSGSPKESILGEFLPPDQASRSSESAAGYSSFGQKVFRSEPAVQSPLARSESRDSNNQNLFRSSPVADQQNTSVQNVQSVPLASSLLSSHQNQPTPEVQGPEKEAVATTAHTANVSTSQQPSNLLGTGSELLEQGTPASGENAKLAKSRANVLSTIIKIREEIYSWARIPNSQIEANIYVSGGAELPFAQQNFDTNLTADAFLKQNLRQLESDDLVVKLIGIWAEKAAYNHLLHLYQSKKPLDANSKYLRFPIHNFGMANWISSTSNHFDKNKGTSDDTKGYDFFYEQTNGTKVYVEVKGHAALATSFFVSANEWEVARSFSKHKGEIYIVLGINLNMLTRQGPHIGYLLEDPVLMEENGTIVKRPSSYVVEIYPRPRDAAVDPEEPKSDRVILTAKSHRHSSQKVSRQKDNVCDTNNPRKLEFYNSKLTTKDCKMSFKN